MSSSFQTKVEVVENQKRKQHFRRRTREELRKSLGNNYQRIDFRLLFTYGYLKLARFFVTRFAIPTINVWYPLHARRLQLLFSEY